MQETVELREYFFIIKKWLWLIILSMLLAGGTAFAVSKWMVSPIYQASTTLLITQSSNPTTFSYQDILSSQRVAQTYAELLQKRPVLEETLKRLGYTYIDLDKPPFKVKVRPVRDTQLIELYVESIYPRLAKEIADTLPQVFIQQYEAVQTRRFASSKENLAKQLARLESDIKGTERALEQLKEDHSAQAQAKRAQLESVLTQYQSSYSNLLRSYEEIRLAEAQSMDNIAVIEPAQMPEKPVRPRVKLNTILAAMVGAMLAVGTAFLIEYLDDTIKTSDEVQQVLELPTLGSIIRMPDREAKGSILFKHRSRSPVAESYRTLRTNLTYSALDRPLNTLLITSPTPEEGKSVTAANLGIVMAQAGQPVVVVSCDLRRPTLHTLFDLPNNKGLTNALFEQETGSEVNNYLHSTPLDNLWVMPSGPLPPNPAELLGSQRFNELIKRLGQDGRTVILDSPPVLAVADAAILARWVDGVLLVVRAGSTRRQVASQAKEALTKVGANLLGVVLNDVPASGRGYYYYHYYYYSEDGEGHRKRRRRASKKGIRNPIALLRRQLARFPWSGGAAGRND